MLKVKPLVLRIPKTAPVKQNENVGHRRAKLDVIHALEREMGQASRPRVVLDCSELEDMRVAEVGLLMDCLEWVMKRNGDARLACVSPNSRKILSNSGSESLFRIYESNESALRSFDSHANVEIVGERTYGNMREFDQNEGKRAAPSFSTSRTEAWRDR